MDFDKAVSLCPNKSRGYSCRGNFYLDQKNMTGAAKDFDEAIRLEPTNGSTYADRAFLRICIKNRPGAFDDLSTSICLKPKVFTYLVRGLIREGNGDLSGALGDYDQSLVLDSHSAMAHRLRGAARLLRKDFRGALSDDVQSIVEEPLNFSAYQQAFKTLERTGYTEKKISEVAPEPSLSTNGLEFSFAVTGPIG